MPDCVPYNSGDSTDLEGTSEWSQYELDIGGVIGWPPLPTTNVF